MDYTGLPRRKKDTNIIITFSIFIFWHLIQILIQHCENKTGRHVILKLFFASSATSSFSSLWQGSPVILPSYDDKVVGIRAHNLLSNPSYTESPEWILDLSKNPLSRRVWTIWSVISFVKPSQQLSAANLLPTIQMLFYYIGM